MLSRMNRRAISIASKTTLRNSKQSVKTFHTSNSHAVSTHAQALNKLFDGRKYTTEYYKDYAEAHKKLKKAEEWRKAFPNASQQFPRCEDTSYVREHAEYQHAQEDMEEAIRKCSDDLLAIDYKNKNVFDNEDELINRLRHFNAQYVKLKSDYASMLFKDDNFLGYMCFVQGHILALRKKLNPNFQVLVIANNVPASEHFVTVAKEMNLKVYFLHTHNDAYTPAVLAVPEENRFIISDYSNFSDIRFGIVRIAEQLKISGETIGLSTVIGNLSEDPRVAEWCEKNNIVFIGPSSQAMKVFSDKAKAKEAAKAAGVPIAESYNGDNQDMAVLKAEAERIGYPVFVKQSQLSGAGRGNRFVKRIEDFDKMKNEIKGGVTIEQYIENARHLEIQMMGDLIVDGRDCTKQRKYQKIAEQRISPEDFAKVHPYAIRMAQKAKELGYKNLGTFEFLRQGDKFYLMEMNTRLQAEHPVTNIAMGLDLINWGLIEAVGRSTEHYLRKQFNYEYSSLTPQQMLDRRRDETQKIRTRQIRYLLVDVSVKEEREEDGKTVRKKVEFTPITGKVTKIVLPEGKDAKGVNDGSVKIDLALKVGTVLDPSRDPQRGQVVAKGRTDEEALLNALKALSQIHIEVDGKKVNAHAKYVAFNLHTLYKEECPLSIETWERHLDPHYIKHWEHHKSIPEVSKIVSQLEKVFEDKANKSVAKSSAQASIVHKRFYA